MYSDEDLDYAVKQGVFSPSSVQAFRELQFSIKESSHVDEENFRLIGGFNDIFIVIACSLFVFSTSWIISFTTASDVLPSIAVTILSWLLAEFFVRKRRMALPAIVLLFFFAGGAFQFSSALIDNLSSHIAILVGAIATAILTYLHWLRFRVPITIAVATACVFAILAALAIEIFPLLALQLHFIAFVCGLLCFSFAMYWDSSDTDRTTHRADIAFWLHLLSAPLIIHPIFSATGILQGNDSIINMLIVLALYFIMTVISITVDRRAFMVSSLAYVIYALSSVIEQYGGIGYSFASTGAFMGFMLLLLSAYWHKVRLLVVNKLPNKIQLLVPSTQVT